MQMIRFDLCLEWHTSQILRLVCSGVRTGIKDRSVGYVVFQTIFFFTSSDTDPAVNEQMIPLTQKQNPNCVGVRCYSAPDVIHR